MDKKNNHKSTELARLFFREITKIHGNDTWPLIQKSKELGRLLEALFLEVTKKENIHFTTHFARISFASHQFHLNKRTQYWIHFFRKKLRADTPEDEHPHLYHLGLRTLSQCIAGLFDEAVPNEILNEIPSEIRYQFTEVKVKKYLEKVRVLALEDDEENDCLLARDEANPSFSILVKYNIAERNASFNPTIQQIRKTFGMPVILSLLDVEVDDKGVYRPRAIVIDPDHLLDVSIVANCFQGKGAEPIVYLLNKYLPFKPSIPLILGNIANFFLDELMHNPKANFKKTFPKVFKTNPLTFSMLPDAAIREIYQKSQKHWVTLQTMVMQGMKKSGIEPSDCYLEPSFYDDTHGLQGRLDILFKKKEDSAIIELKSGKPFMPNKYGIGASHFIQTLLYDLMVRSVFMEKIEPASYILYSGLDTNQLRYAPRVKSEQNEALQVRNQLVSINRLLAKIHGNVSQTPLFQRVTTARFPNIKGYLQGNIELFEKTYSSLDDLERYYFNGFSGFIAREHQLAKTGIQGVDNANGLASLWLDSFEEKERNFQVIKSLKIKDNKASEEEALIVFDKTENTSELANFRTGDIAVLYPEENNPSDQSHARSPITTQLFKVTVLEITPQKVTVKLRYKQFNRTIFEEYEMWNLEHDQMDMSFNSMYQGLFRFAQSKKVKRDLLLTIKPPSKSLPTSDSNNQGFLANTKADAQTLTDEQKSILEKMLVAQDYFLLWGPPGTGKTSKMLKNYAGWIFENTDENLLLLAYTNRAVDEICDALESLGDEVKDTYLRIGSPHSTAKRFENQLLSKKIEQVTKREELKGVLGRHRIFVSTLASLSNNLVLLTLKRFKRVVIDEASQILEPMLVGLLPNFEQFILIGDHKQLPAVVVQTSEASKVDNEELKAIGLQNLRNSLFERLYKRCCDNKWDWAYDHLSHQGRMHEDIMRFPGELFYEGKLKILPQDIGYSKLQTIPLSSQPTDLQEEWAKQVSKNRIVFISTPVDWETPSRKTNQHEAKQIAQLVLLFQSIYEPSKINQKSIGIITPYRAQIAQIQEILKNKQIDCEHLTIDTVERYQGGARDIILISLCTNAVSQLESLVSLSDEGVDRKLNVALTRAREHVVILGNEEILKQNDVYLKLINYCRSLTTT